MSIYVDNAATTRVDEEVLNEMIPFFSENYGRTDTEREYRYNLVLFREIKRYLVYYEQLGIGNVILNLLGNIVAFMPYGFLLPMVNKACKNGWRIFLWS